MKKLKPYDLKFKVGGSAYLLTLKQYGFEMRKERSLEVFEGALSLIDMGLEPTTFEKVEAAPDILKEGLKAIKVLPRKERVKIARRDTRAVIIRIKPDASWQEILQVQKHIGVI